MHRSSIVNLFGGEGGPSREEDEAAASEPDEEVGQAQFPDPKVVELIPRFQEQAGLLSFAMEMRNESSFCDISFVVGGSIFRAHRVIVSAWSRWLRALLCEGDDDVISLDLFSPEAFGAVMDYMYGQPLFFSTELANPILKVVRRLELKILEQECWKHLLSVVDASNCRELHELADRFDCPPLKLTSWHILQDVQRGYGANPSSRLLNHDGEATSGDVGVGPGQPPTMPFALKGSGLTGPGETESFYHEDRGDGSDNEEYLSVFNDYTDEFRMTRGDDSTTYSEEQEQLFPLPEQLPFGAPATDVIKAWAYKLQLVYDMCAPNENYRNFDDTVGDADVPSHLQQYGAEPSQYNHHPDNVGGETSASGAEEEKLKKDLIEYYIDRGLTEKIESVDNILANFRGRGDLIFEALHNKYDDPTSADYIHPSNRKTGHPRQHSKGFLGNLFS